VPAILHVSTNKYLMESAPIAEFLEATYPDPPVPLTSELGREIETKARAATGPALRPSIMLREARILLPRGEDYFRRTREAMLGQPLEQLLDLEQEDQMWDAVADSMRAVSDLIQTRKADGPFVLGAKPSYTDFFLAGSLQSVRTIDEGVFERIFKFPGQRAVYEACLPYMEKKD
jgi:glutathione S-transferase